MHDQIRRAHLLQLSQMAHGKMACHPEQPWRAFVGLLCCAACAQAARLHGWRREGHGPGGTVAWAGGCPASQQGWHPGEGLGAQAGMHSVTTSKPTTCTQRGPEAAACCLAALWGRAIGQQCIIQAEAGDIIARTAAAACSLSQVHVCGPHASKTWWAWVITFPGSMKKGHHGGQRWGLFDCACVQYVT